MLEYHTMKDRPRGQRRKLPIDVKREGQFATLHYEAPRVMGAGTVPMTSYANSPLGEAVVAVIQAFRALEQEHEDMIHDYEELRQENATLRLRAEVAEGKENQLKGKLRQASSPVGKR